MREKAAASHGLSTKPTEIIVRSDLRVQDKKKSGSHKGSVKHMGISYISYIYIFFIYISYIQVENLRQIEDETQGCMRSHPVGLHSATQVSSFTSQIGTGVPKCVSAQRLGQDTQDTHIITIHHISARLTS